MTDQPTDQPTDRPTDQAPMQYLWCYPTHLVPMQYLWCFPAPPLPCTHTRVGPQPPPYGDKLKTASCSSLANIALALRRLGQVDTDMLALMAQASSRKAKHGSMCDLSVLAAVLRKGGWADKQVRWGPCWCVCVHMLVY